MPAPITTPQTTVREALAVIGIDTGDRRVILTDCDDVGERAFTYLINPSQLEYACEQHRIATGESIDYASLEAALPWIDDDEEFS